MKTIALIGNPNCGKTTIFNALTAEKQPIGNWPGVTVEKKSGVARFQVEKRGGGGEDCEVKVVDLPGVYSLTATSADERATLEYVLTNEADLYVNVVDATALERNLYLTLLMCELKVPMVVVVSMMDIARRRNIDIQIEHLSEHLGVPVVGVNGNNPLDIRKLQDLLSSLIPDPRSLIPAGVSKRQKRVGGAGQGRNANGKRLPVFPTGGCEARSEKLKRVLHRGTL